MWCLDMNARTVTITLSSIAFDLLVMWEIRAFNTMFAMASAVKPM